MQTKSYDAAHRPAGKPELYLERQRPNFCAVHALNATLGGSVFDPNRFDWAAHRVVENMASATEHDNAASEELLDRHRSPNGMYSEQVLFQVLLSDGRWQIDPSSYSEALTVLSHQDHLDTVCHRKKPSSDFWVTRYDVSHGGEHCTDITSGTRGSDVSAYT